MRILPLVFRSHFFYFCQHSDLLFNSLLFSSASYLLCSCDSYGVLLGWGFFGWFIFPCGSVTFPVGSSLYSWQNCCFCQASLVWLRQSMMCHEIRGWKGATSSGCQEEQVEHLLWVCCALPLADPPCPCACTCAGNIKFHNILSIKWDNNCVQQPVSSHGKWLPCTHFSALLLQVLGVCGLCVGQWRLWSQPEKFLAVYSLNEKCCIFLAEL